MKNLVTILAITCFTLTSAQSNNLKGPILKDKIKFENLNISVTVDSAEDIKSTFSVDDIKDILLKTEDSDDLSFKIICENKTENRHSNLTYKVNGSTNDISGFLKSIKVIRKSAIKYYKNKA